MSNILEVVWKGRALSFMLHFVETLRRNQETNDSGYPWGRREWNGRKGQKRETSLCTHRRMYVYSACVRVSIR